MKNIFSRLHISKSTKRKSFSTACWCRKKYIYRENLCNSIWKLFFDCIEDVWMYDEPNLASRLIFYFQFSLSIFQRDYSLLNLYFFDHCRCYCRECWEKIRLCSQRSSLSLWYYKMRLSYTFFRDHWSLADEIRKLFFLQFSFSLSLSLLYIVMSALKHVSTMKWPLTMMNLCLFYFLQLFHKFRH